VFRENISFTLKNKISKDSDPAKKKKKKYTLREMIIWKMIMMSQLPKKRYWKEAMASLFGDYVKNGSGTVIKNTVHTLVSRYLKNFHTHIFLQWTEVQLHKINANINTTKELSDFNRKDLYWHKYFLRHIESVLTGTSNYIMYAFPSTHLLRRITS
jgi:hypothetical protein